WGGPLRFWARAAPLLGRHWGDGWRLVVAAGLIGQWPLFGAMGRGGRLLVLFAAFLDVAYPLLGMPFFSWYAVPFAVATLYGVVFAALAPARLRARARLLARSGQAAAPWRMRMGGAVGALVLAFLLAPLGLAGWRWFQVFNWQPHLDT